MTLRIVSHVDIQGLQETVEALGDVQYTWLDPAAEVPDTLEADVLLTTVVHGESTRALMHPRYGIDWIHVFGTGIDGFDISAVGDRELTCSRGATAIPIAEWTLAMILASAKQLPDSWCTRPPERWHFASLQSLAGQTLALAGLGSIGQAVARRALAFEMRVKALVRKQRPTPVAGVELVTDVPALLADADHIVLAAPATPATRHLLNAGNLAGLKPGAHLVNVARASLIDEHALREALEDGRLARASIDVADPEPLPASHWFYNHPQVYFSPHISWSSPSVMQPMVDRFVVNVEHRLHGRSLEFEVNKAAGY